MYADQPADLVSLGSAGSKSPVDWVDPLIDTHQSRWFYFNSASRPFGLVNLSPDTQTRGSWKSGYLYGDKHIRCFSHIHAWQMSGIPVMPTFHPSYVLRRYTRPVRGQVHADTQEVLRLLRESTPSSSRND